MATNNRRAGIIFVKAGSRMLEVKGNWTYNLGAPKRDAIVGADKVHGFKEAVQVPYIEGAITDSAELDLKNDLLLIEEETVTLELNNGKVIVLREAWYASEGDVTTEEAEVKVRFEGISAEEIR